MEYSPGNAIPYVSRVDAGTVEAVRAAGAEVVSSGDLIQRFEAVWSAEALATHRKASDGAVPHQGSRVRDLVRDARRDGRPLTEYDVQQPMVGWFAEEGSGHRRRARTCRRRKTPATRTTCRRAAQPRAFGADEVVLLDLWGKLRRPGAVFADITWVGFTRPSGVPDRYARAFAAARDGRDAAIALVQRAAAERAGAARDSKWTARAATCIERAGYGAQFIHRTGHSLGTDVHGNGVHMDDLRDTRRAAPASPGTGFTIEPASTRRVRRPDGDQHVRRRRARRP